jgi:two-component system sensor histidine kinase DesK
VWLIFLPAFLVEPALRHASAGAWTAYIAAAAAFVVVYVHAQRAGGRPLVIAVLVPLAFGLGFSPANTGAYIFFTYAASSAAKIERSGEAAAWIVAITAIGLLVAFGINAPLYFWLGHGVFTPLIGAVNLHFAQVGRANAKVRAANAEIEHLAAVAERERIARDLHDVLGHTLSLIVLKAELASKLADRDPARAVKEIRDVESVSRAALKEVREAIRGYRPTLDDELARARTLLDTARIDATIDATIERQELKVRDGVEEVLALALREAVTNVVRHSGASRSTIRAWREAVGGGGRVVLEVADDGRGTRRPEGAGLRGMRERVEAVDGCLTSSLIEGAGTRLTVAIPLVVAPMMGEWRAERRVPA